MEVHELMQGADPGKVCDRCLTLCFWESSWTNTRNHSALQLSTYLSQLWTCFWQTGGKLKAEALLWGSLVGKINIYLHAVGFPPGISNFQEL